MPYIPLTNNDKKEMLKKIGVNDFKTLLKQIDPILTKENSWNLEKGLSEFETKKKLNKISNKNKTTEDYICFAGAGIYDHYIPSAVNHIANRPEFYTAYTPYQPEVSQGTLQSIFEYQSMICELTNMEVSNASMYDAATAAAEAALMAINIKRKKKILISNGLHPSYTKVIKSYLKNNYEIDYFSYTKEGFIDLNDLEAKIDNNTAGVIFSYINFFGIIEDIERIIKFIHKNNLLAIVNINPFSLTLLEPPGSFDADIVIGEGQPLGLEMSFGGPLLGILSTKKKYIRKMPGRIIGETKDIDGKRAFVMTLQTREQHIKRERATSNICTNQAFCALKATVYLSLIGKNGLENISKRSVLLAHDLFDKLMKIKNINRKFSGKFFNEFVIELPIDADIIVEKMFQAGILPGVSLGRFNKDWSKFLLVCVTEKRNKKEIDNYINNLNEILNN